MNAQSPVRGAELLAAGRIGIGPHWLARLAAGGFGRVLDRIDRGLASGSLEVTLPTGGTRMLGGRTPGFTASVELCQWNALVRLATGGSVGWYQAWEAGEWASADPVTLCALFMANADTLGSTARARGPWRLAMRALHALRRNTHGGALRNIHAHYDLGNDFYAAWLDPGMSYSSARFGGVAAGPGRLERAQQRKMDLLIARLGLGEGDRVLEIGCGWGALAARIAQATKAPVTAISLSEAQLAWARQHSAGADVQFEHRDYRDVTGIYDAVVSVEMVEAVGAPYWRQFIDCIATSLKPGGRAALQYITIRDDLFDAYAASADFIQTYVFPGGMLLRESTFHRLAEARGLAWQDGESFGHDYAETLRLWRERFDLAVDEGRLPAGFDARFVRLWRFYLMYCEGGFRSGGIDVAHVTLVKAL